MVMTVTVHVMLANLIRILYPLYVIFSLLWLNEVMALKWTPVFFM